MIDRQLEREITPESTYLNRRMFMRAGVLAATAAASALVYRRLNAVDLSTTELPPVAGLVTAPHANGYWVDEPMTPRASILNYNNFYEFTTDKDGVAAAAAGFKTDGWQLSVGGLVNKPRVFNMDDLRRLSAPEERIYRMRCVEAWSMVIPWAGYSLSTLLAAVEPTADAKYVAFETLHDPARMPGQHTDVLAWPYVEGYRGQLGVNDVNFAIRTTGLIGLVFITLSLVITPLRALTGWNRLIAIRRNVGVLGFAYLAAHFLIFFWWDRQGSVRSTFTEIVMRKYLWFGAGALALMIPLAVTSTDNMLSRLGSTRWKRLHRLAYPIAIGAAIHYYLLVKSDVRQPLAFAAVNRPRVAIELVTEHSPARLAPFSCSTTA